MLCCVLFGMLKIALFLPYFDAVFGNNVLLASSYPCGNHVLRTGDQIVPAGRTPKKLMPQRLAARTASTTAAVPATGFPFRPIVVLPFPNQRRFFQIRPAIWRKSPDQTAFLPLL